MLAFFILALLSCSINSIWAATPFKDCGSELGTVVEFEVTNCTAIPCVFYKGNTYSMNLTFQAKAASKATKILIHGIIGGVPVPFPLPDSDACKLGVKCPVSENDSNIATFALKVEQSYPAISLYAKIEVLAVDPNQDYICLIFPATIKSNSAENQHRVGWKKGKLFDILH